MKISNFILLTGISACKHPCMVKTATASECQTMCNHSTHCEAWEFSTSKTCHMKKRTGWTPKEKSGCYAGFRNENIIVKDTQLDGGDYMC